MFIIALKYNNYLKREKKNLNIELNKRYCICQNSVGQSVFMYNIINIYIESYLLLHY